MQRSILVAVLLWFAIAVPTASQSPERSREPRITREEYEIYSALIEQYYVREKVKVFPIDKVKVLFIARRTWPFQLAKGSDRMQNEFVEAIHRLAPADAIADFNERNRSAAALEDRFHTALKSRLVGKKEERRLQDLMNTGRWDKRYPTSPGILTLTRIGFSSDRTRAIVGLAHTCGNMCGETAFGLFVKDQHRWKFERWSSITEIS